MSLGFSRLYLADLDAILSKSANFSTYSQITTKNGLDLMVDAGISDITLAGEVLDAGVSRIVMALRCWILLSQVKAVSFTQLDRRLAFLSDDGGKKR